MTFLFYTDNDDFLSAQTVVVSCLHRQWRFLVYTGSGDFLFTQTVMAFCSYRATSREAIWLAKASSQMASGTRTWPAQWWMFSGAGIQGGMQGGIGEGFGRGAGGGSGREESEGHQKRLTPRSK